VTVTPEQSVDAANAVFGRHLLTRAAHMQGDPIAATVRVSNGGGNPNVPDYQPDVRHPTALITLPAGLPALKPVASYATCTYYGTHAFRFVDADGGSRYVRYTFVPDGIELSDDPILQFRHQAYTESVRRRMEG